MSILFLKELEDFSSIPNVNIILLYLFYLLSGESAVEAAAISYFQTNHVSFHISHISIV